MKKSLLKTVSFTLLGASSFASTAYAEGGWSFGNISVNYLDWSNGTEDRTQAGAFGGKKDFPYLEIEGGGGNKYGEWYGFFDLENFHNSRNNKEGRNLRTALKVSGRYNLTTIKDTPIQLYGHIYDFRESGFYDQNRVVGLGTSWSNGNFWIKPFIGFHQEFKSGIGAKMNGGMVGYVAGYNFKLFDQSFMITNWHETEFARKDKFLLMGDRHSGVALGKSTSFNGAVSLWWTPVKSITTGISYRYADQKLGSTASQNALIYTIKYNF